jgi:hypothetical protein
MLCLLLGGCMTSGLTGALPVVEEGNAAQIIVIRPSHMKAVGTAYPILIDGVKAYNLGSGEHVTIPVTAGRRILAIRCIAATTINDDLTRAVTLTRGEPLYFTLEPAVWTCPTLTPIPPAEATRLTQDTTDITGVQR